MCVPSPLVIPKLHYIECALVSEKRRKALERSRVVLDCYLISLKDRSDRRTTALAHLKPLGLNIHHIEALDGRAKKAEDFSQYSSHGAKRTFGRSLLGAELGCYQSHIKALNRFLDTSANHALVVEDDCCWQSPVVQPIDELVEKLDGLEPGWHLAQMGHRVKRLYTREKPKFAGGQIVRAHHLPTTATAILWSRQGANQFISDFQSIQMPYDHALRVWNLRYDKGYGLTQAVFSNSGSSSDIVIPPKLKQSFLRRRFRMWADRWRASANMLKYRVKRRFGK